MGAIQVKEKFESRRLTTGNDASLELVYSVTGSDDELEVKSAVESLAPLSYGSPAVAPYLIRQSVTVEPIGQGLWLATVYYDRTGAAPHWAEDSYEFDTSGGTQHITQSIGTVGGYAAPGWGLPSFEGAIGVSDNGVEGVDITVPQLNFSETHHFSSLPGKYRQTLFRITGKVNSAPFRGFAAGEVLFLGASGAKRDRYHETPWEVTYRFAVSPNESNLVVGNIGGITKRGWDYMWIRYAELEDQNAIVKRPVGVYVERVYGDANFGLLGIGTND